MTSSIWFLAELIPDYPAAPREHLLRLAGVSLSEMVCFFATVDSYGALWLLGE